MSHAAPLTAGPRSAREKAILSSPSSLFQVENHDEALAVWRRAGVKNRILLHLDAHDDLEYCPDLAPVTIGNFLCPALQEGLIREVYWVAPDPTWKSPRTLKPLIRHLKRVIRGYPGRPAPLTVHPAGWSTTVLGRPWHICSLDHLPPLTESVLLDIDLDFLVIRLAGGGENPHAEPPWCWPGELAARLRAKGVHSDLITLAASVAGGFTPLTWKYFTDELALRLRASLPAADHQWSGMACLQAGAEAFRQGDHRLAAQRYLEARSLLPGHPAPLLHLAHLRVAEGKEFEAQQHYQQALALDPTYRTPYNSGGLWYCADGDLKAAAREHRRTLALDPGDAYAHFGLAQLAAKRRRWGEAETYLKQCLELNGEMVDAHRLRGKILAKQGRRREAIAAYERSLALTLAGRQPLRGPIVTQPGEPRLLDPDHFRVQVILARLYELEGRVEQARVGYRLGLAAGCPGVFPHSRLTCLCGKQRRWREAGHHAAQALKALPRDAGQTGRRWWFLLVRRLKRILARDAAVSAGKP